MATPRPETPRAAHEEQRQEHPAQGRDAQPPRDARASQQGDGYVGPHHEEIAVGKIQEEQDPVDHGVAQGYQGVHGAHGQPIDQLLQNDIQAGTSG